MCLETRPQAVLRGENHGGPVPAPVESGNQEKQTVIRAPDRAIHVSFDIKHRDGALTFHSRASYRAGEQAGPVYDLPALQTETSSHGVGDSITWDQPTF